MKLILILPDVKETSAATQQIWQDVCTNEGVPLEVLDSNNENHQALVLSLELNTFPALILDNKVIAVGHPDKQTADKIISRLIKSQAS